MNGDHYEAKKSTGGFWGFVKKIFKGDDEDEVNELVKEAVSYYIIPSLLESIARSIVKYVNKAEISPILTEKKFNYLLQEKFGMIALEKKIVEKHLFRTHRLKYSKAVIEGKGFKKEYRIMIVGD